MLPCCCERSPPIRRFASSRCSTSTAIVSTWSSLRLNSTSSSTYVAMESTGVYWHAVWNLLEGQVELLLVNARHIKQVPGRKTDVRDCEWIAIATPRLRSPVRHASLPHRFQRNRFERLHD